MGSPVTPEQIQHMQADFAQHDRSAVIQRAAMRSGVLEASYDSTAKARLTPVFSDEVKTGSVTNQRHSGRCWLFSLLNTLRHDIATKYHVKDFELSQAYSYFWDKIERANIFYDRVIALADRPTTDRELTFYLETPGNDGGQWAMAASLVEKYGVVPASVMPETFNTNNTAGFGSALNLKLRRDALVLRRLIAKGATKDEIKAKRSELLTEVYRMTATAVGEPPKSFSWSYEDDDHKYHREAETTPLEFFKQHLTFKSSDYVVLANSPEKAYNQHYSLPAQDNVVGGTPITFVNTEMENLATATIAQIKAGETVWFGNDVLEQMNRKDGLLDTSLYQLDALFDVDLDMTKAERLSYHEAEVSHAMTITGVDLVAGQPTKWKVENSWGDELGTKGYFVMSPEWFNEYTYEVVVRREFISAELQAVADAPVEILPAWDSLA